MDWSIDRVVEVLDKQVVQVIRPETISGNQKNNINNTNNIRGVSYDTREVSAEEIFITIDGRNKGIDFLESAGEKGVSVFIVAHEDEEKLNAFRQKKFFKSSTFILVNDTILSYGLLAKKELESIPGKKIAITGSAGKTLLKECLAQVLGSRYQIFASEKNFNNHLGLPKNIFKLSKQYRLNQNHYDYLIFEIGMNHFGEIDYLANIIKPNLAIVTNVLHAHIGNFPNREAIAEAKAEVVPHILEGGKLFLPEDIFEREIFLKKLPPGVVPIPVATKISAINSWSRSEGEEISNSHFQVSWQLLENETRLQATAEGLHFFSEEILSLVLQVSEDCGMSKEEIFKQFQKITPSVESRLQIIKKPGHPLVIDDAYNANPDSMKKTIELLISLILPQLNRDQKNEKLILVLGDILELGEQSDFFHQELGKSLSKFLSHLKPLKEEKITGIEFFFMGDKMKLCYDNIQNTKKYFFTQKNQLLASLLNQTNQQSIVFFKASHGMDFKTLIDNFLN